MKNLLLFLVSPVHFAFVMLNEGASEPSISGALPNSSPGLFASVVSRAGGDPVSYSMPLFSSSMF